MSDIVVRAEGLGKRYIIGHQSQRQGYVALRDVLAQGARSLWTRTRDLVAGRPVTLGDVREEVWALRDVNLEVRRGEAVAIIGRNGAGKSTFLKVLSRITEPSAGRVTITGRVASLLEVGTGFHPELTGRENVFLNGAILGMTRSEIRRRFDEIVSFAEVERFVDTPVKRYSSGMHVRLAFAVAAHLEPEILVVDEVLAVGDLAFQRKCLAKMGEVSHGGRTVLFVSHNMAAVQSLCETAHMLERGRVTSSGHVRDVVADYIRSMSAAAAVPLDERRDRKGDGRMRLKSISIDGGADGAAVRCGDPLRIRIEYASGAEVAGAAFLVGIYDEFNRPVFFLDTRTSGWEPAALPAAGTVTCVTGPVNITPGRCSVNIAVLVGGETADHIKHAFPLDIEPDDFFGTGKLPDRQQSLCLLPQRWGVEARGAASATPSASVRT